MAKDNLGRKPDYQLRVKVKGENTRPGNQVGVAWKLEGGGISIVLNPGTVLRWDDELWIGLYPPMSEDERREKFGRKYDREPESPPFD